MVLANEIVCNAVSGWIIKYTLHTSTISLLFIGMESVKKGCSGSTFINGGTVGELVQCVSYKQSKRCLLRLYAVQNDGK
jgi:hypothetical protein